MPEYLRTKLPALRVAFIATFVVIGACSADAPTQPDLQTPIRRSGGFMCVGNGAYGGPIDTIAPTFGDSCPPGYDNIPWY